MVNINIQVSMPVRVRCVQCQVDLKLEPGGVNPAIAKLKCPGCGYKIQLIQGLPARPLGRKLGPWREIRPPPKT